MNIGPGERAQEQGGSVALRYIDAPCPSTQAVGIVVDDSDHFDGSKS